jgi:hypothetical protein
MIMIPLPTSSATMNPIPYKIQNDVAMMLRIRKIPDSPSTFFVLKVVYTCGQRSTDKMDDPMYPKYV